MTKYQSTQFINSQIFIKHRMASKQPFKLINIAQTLTTWSIRITKFFKHRLLSKRKHVLLISEDQLSNLNSLKSLYIVEKGNNPLVKVTQKPNGQASNDPNNFQKLLFKNLYKTWEISQLKSINSQFQSFGFQLNRLVPNQNQNKNPQGETKEIKPKEQQSNQKEPSTIILSKFTDKNAVEALQSYWVSKKKYFDSIIVLPQKPKPNLFPQISDEAFATSFITTFQEKIMKNMVAYRYAHKFLNTSGTLIQSTSEYDFLKKTDEEKKIDEQKKIESKDEIKEKFLSYSDSRPAASKQMIDHTIAYLGVVVGDRDHMDLNSWTLVSLGQQASWKNAQYVGKMYYDWADGQQLPMPGSFALFKKKRFENGKQLDFIQYL